PVRHRRPPRSAQSRWHRILRRSFARTLGRMPVKVRRAIPRIPLQWFPAVLRRHRSSRRHHRRGPKGPSLENCPRGAHTPVDGVGTLNSNHVARPPATHQSKENFSAKHSNAALKEVCSELLQQTLTAPRTRHAVQTDPFRYFFFTNT